MATSPPFPAFEHDPLPEHTSHFRLLHILRGDFGQHVECEISAWPIDDAPPYYAISYTWGDPADTAEITVNGRPLVVRRNCEYVLQQAFASKTSKYFWMDAICIAQTTEEKNHQVGIMGQIYSRAEHVLACVGPHENDSELLPEMTRKYRSLLRKIHESEKPMRFSGWHNPIYERRILSLRCLFSMESTIRQRFRLSFYEFMKRPYFQRLWIIQELHLAHDVSFCFGTAMEAAEDFLALYRLGDFQDNPIVFYRVSKLISPIAFFFHPRSAPYQTEYERTVRPSFYGIGTPSALLHFACTERKQDVDDILLDCKVQCSDPRDRLFGVLSLVEWPAGQSPKPDYTKDRFEVALDALKLICELCMPDADWILAQRLCQRFQVTGNEASLRHALNLRSRVISNLVDPWHVLRDQRIWKGFEISSGAEDLERSGSVNGNGLRISVSSTEHEGCCILKLEQGSRTISIPAPLGTRSGDWCIFNMSLSERRSEAMLLRKSESGQYNVMGQTYHNQGHLALSDMVSQSQADVRFRGYWYPEDLLLLGWTVNELESHKIGQEQMTERINRRICAWDGSSFFKLERGMVA